MKLGPYLLGYNDVNQGLYVGDSKVLCEEIPDESIDVIMTDPVYQNIEDYRWLGEIALRVLKEGGMVLAQVGSEFRYAAETAMMAYLIPLPLLAEVYHMAFRRMWKYRVMQGWKPYLWFCKGDTRNGGFVFDRFHSKQPNKQFHKWGDSTGFITTYINALTIPGGVILDPFTGGGTVPAACKVLSRNYLAFEIKPQTATMARKRLIETPIPLPNITTTQLDLSL